MIEKQLHKLRNFYNFRQRLGFGLCWLGTWRKRLKRIAKEQKTKNVIFFKDLLFPVDAKDQATYNIWLRGRLFPDLEWAIDRYVKKGTIAVDIGANLGYVSILMAKRVGDKGEVFSIEPNPSLIPRLKKIFWLNGFSNYNVCQCACSDKEGSMNFSVDRSDHTKSGLNQTSSGIEVQLFTLDSIIGSIEKQVSFIKIDVEGHEPEVLQGAIKTLQKHRPVVVFESGTHHSSDQLSKITKIFGSLGYGIVGTLHEWGIGIDEFPPKPSKKAFSYNVLALPLYDSRTGVNIDNNLYH